MFGHQSDQPQINTSQTSDQVVNNDVTPPPQTPTFTPPQPSSPFDATSFTPPSDTQSLGSSSVMPGVDSVLASDDASEPVDANDLLDIKQQALNQLSPLVGHLEQTPEEKFRTTMMMIQASDNQNLIRDAYDAAQHIADEKAKAQALLDVINEINYFTQHQEA